MSAAAPQTMRQPKSLLARRLPLAKPEVQLGALARVPLTREFSEALQQSGQWPLRRSRFEVMQINVGKLCNQTCRHCHVDAGPDRKESMPDEIFDACLRVAKDANIATLDITGGAPELHPRFRNMVARARGSGLHVIDRCNLTVLCSPQFQDLPHFFAEQEVELICSLPHYRRYNTDRQRGDGVFDKSIRVLRALNAVGYGRNRALRLALVTNPVGAFLPGEQVAMEREWKRELRGQFDIDFDALFTLTNLPISRYLEWLEESGNLESYLGKLEAAFNPSTVPSLMCRTTLSVGWDGALYDCDFNQMLELPVGQERPLSILDVDLTRVLPEDIRTDRHCFGCTAGAGSSCGGSLTA